MTVQMKESGIAWIGEIPEHWGISKVKYHYEICLGKMLQPFQINPGDTLESYLCSANIKWSGVNLDPIKQMWFSPSEKNQYRLKVGDLLVSEGGDVAVACIWKNQLDECYLQNAVHRVRQYIVNDNRFLYYWLFSIKCIGYINLICNKATIAHFTKEKFGDCLICSIPIGEQQVIADFLDKQCALLDSIATDITRQIEILRKYKEAVITETVTKGLDPSVPLKESGITWIGEIPSTWKVQPLKYISNCNTSVLSEATAPDYSFRYVEIGSVTYDKGITNYQIIKFEQAPSRARRIVTKGDTIISTVRTYLKAISFIDDDEDVVVSTGFAVYSPLPQIYPKYLAYYFKSEGFVKTVSKHSYGIVYPAINTDILNRIPICVPNYQEQKEISQYLDEKSSVIDGLIDEKLTQLETIQKYKSSLIYEYVTGKKQVNEETRA